jgi:hypothetical protein
MDGTLIIVGGHMKRDVSDLFCGVLISFHFTPQLVQLRIAPAF